MQRRARRSFGPVSQMCRCGSYGPGDRSGARQVRGNHTDHLPLPPHMHGPSRDQAYRPRPHSGTTRSKPDPSSAFLPWISNGRHGGSPPRVPACLPQRMPAPRKLTNNRPSRTVVFAAHRLTSERSAHVGQADSWLPASAAAGHRAADGRDPRGIRQRLAAELAFSGSAAASTSPGRSARASPCRTAIGRPVRCGGGRRPAPSTKVPAVSGSGAAARPGPGSCGCSAPAPRRGARR